MAEQFRGGLRLSPPESEWVRVSPIASEAESDKKFFGGIKISDAESAADSAE